MHTPREDQMPPPALLRMTQEAILAFKNEAAAIVRGEAAVSGEAFDKRMAICRACESLAPETERCARCGCYVQIKARMRSQRCPAGKW